MKKKTTRVKLCINVDSTLCKNINLVVATSYHIQGQLYIYLMIRVFSATKSRLI